MTTVPISVRTVGGSRTAEHIRLSELIKAMQTQLVDLGDILVELPPLTLATIEPEIEVTHNLFWPGGEP